MRRVFAITTIAALIFSLASPVLAAGCTAMSKVQMCHRGMPQAHHHCDMAMEQDEGTAAPDSEPRFNSLPGQCPMQCCMQDQACNGTAVLADSGVTRLVASEYRVDIPQVAFTRNGFSSHTDRGPPLT